MSKSVPITLSSAALRERVEDHLDRMIPDHTWERSELYARRKLDYYRGTTRTSTTSTTSTSCC